MHTYSINLQERRIVPFVLAGLAGFTMLGVSRGLHHYKVELPWWLPTPLDTLAIYGLFYLAFDRILWRVPLLRLVGLRTPNLSGEWHGKVRPVETTGVSSGLTSEIDVHLSIRQTWTTLIVRAEANLSKSASVTGSILVSDETQLTYVYQNEPAVGAPATMHPHRGTAQLQLLPDGSTLEGDYYSGRGRQNIGSLRVRRLGR